MIPEVVESRIEELAAMGRARMSGSLLFGVKLDTENPTHVLAALAVQVALLESRVGMHEKLNQLERLSRKKAQLPLLKRMLGGKRGGFLRAGRPDEEGGALRIVQSVARSDGHGAG